VRKSSILVIKLALMVQFFALLAVPVLVAADEAPRAIWMAEWVRADATERSIGVLRIRDARVWFEQMGEVEWELDLSSVKRVAAAGGRVHITSMRGEEFIVAVMESNLMPMSPKKVVSAIERALHAATTSR
jgi:hypothetical protein